MTNTVFDTMSKSHPEWQRHDGLFGVEIETETTRSYQIPTLNMWNSTHDGSLRNFGVEYVTVSPYTSEQLQEALNEFKKLKYKFIKNSVSTSVHIHRNVLNEFPMTVVNVLCAYSIFEPVLCKFSGLYRESNLFCLQLRDAEGNLDAIMQLLNTLDQDCNHIGYNDPYGMKYAALNVGSFYRFGSLEFRSMRGVTNTELVFKWSQIIDCLFDYAKSKSDPYEVLQDFQSNASEMLSEIFREYASDLSYEDWEKDCDMNLWLALKIACYKDSWAGFGSIRPLEITQCHLDRQHDKLVKAYKKAGVPVPYISMDDLKKTVAVRMGAKGIIEGVHFIIVPDKKKDEVSPRKSSVSSEDIEMFTRFVQESNQRARLPDPSDIWGEATSEARMNTTSES